MKMGVRRIAWAAVALLVLAIAVYLVTARHSAVAPVKLSVAVTLAPPSALVYIADSRGYFREEALEVTLQSHKFGKAALAYMLAGKADLAVAGETPIMFAAMQDEEMAVIAGIFSSDRDLGIAARRHSGISVPRDLAGKRIGAAPGTAGEYFRYAFLAAHGVPINAIEAVSLPPEGMADALESRRVDAVAIWQPYLLQSEKRLGNAGITFYGESFYTFSVNVAASRQTLADKPAALVAFLRALKKAERFVHQHPAPAQEIVAGAIQFDLATLKEFWNDSAFRVSLEQSLLIAMENEAKWAIRAGLVNRKEAPNFLDFIHFDSLNAADPNAVTILH